MSEAPWLLPIVPLAVHLVLRRIIGLHGAERLHAHSNYVLLGTPYRGARSVWTEGAVRARLDVVAAEITLHMGLNFMREIMWEGEVEIGADKIHEGASASPLRA